VSRLQLVAMAMGAAYRAQRQFGVDPKSRVDVFGVLKAAEAYVFFRPLKSMCGAYIPAEGPLPAMLINSNLPLSRQRYTAAHELGHVFMKHKAVSLDPDVAFSPEERNRLDEDEIVAEAFAAFFLMPKPLVVTSLRELEVKAENLTPRGAYLLGLRMGTSYQATVNQLQTLKLVTASGAAKLRKLQPKEIKQGLNDEQALGRHDIWVLDEQWNDRQIYPAPEDIIRIQLPEIPRSGYTWLWKGRPKELAIIEDEYKGEEQGVGGTRIHEFVARLAESTQQAKLVLEKRMPWDEDASPSAGFTVELRPQEIRRTGPLVLPKLA
jgi:Zn-dependent peptidase ImmA (M78 family)/predicted secreted protein